MPTVEHAGASIAYDDSGESHLPPVVLLPGLSNARTTWARVASHLAGRFRVIAVDHRGHGQSSHAAGTYTLSNWGPDAIALCDQVVGGPAVLVGHSLGGVVAHYIAVHRSDLVRGLFLEDPPLYLGSAATLGETPYRALFRMMQDSYRTMRADGADAEAYLAMVRSVPAMNGVGSLADSIGEDAARAMAEGLVTLDLEVFTPAIEGHGLDGAEPDRPVSCPVTVLRTDPGMGPAFSAEHEARFLATNPRATVTMIQGASHLIHDEQPQRFLSELESFLDTV